MTNSITQQQLTLYYSPTCPFCHRVFDALDALGLTPNLDSNRAGEITLKDRKNKDALAELVQGGGKKTVPCLLINGDNGKQWMYESGDIAKFLVAQFG